MALFIVSLLMIAGLGTGRLVSVAEPARPALKAAGSLALGKAAISISLEIR